MISKFILSHLGNLSIRMQVLFLMTGLGITISFLVGMGVYFYSIRELDETIEKMSESQTALISNLSMDAMITQDRPALQTVIDGLKDLNIGLVGVRIVNAQDSVLAEWDSVVLTQPEVVEVKKEIVFFSQHFGNVCLKWERGYFSAPIKKEAMEMCYIVIGFCSLMGFAFLVFVEFYFIKPLKFLEGRVEAFATNEDSEFGRRKFLAKEVSLLNDRLTNASKALMERAENEQKLQRKENKLQAIQATAKAKSDFLSLMSHEIRTPLGAILGFAQLLEHSDLGEEEKGFVNHIRESGDFLLTIINDILDLSKIEAKGIELESEHFWIEKEIGDLESMLSASAEEKNIKLKIQTTGTSNLRVLGDCHRIKQVLLNLAGNAIKFTNEGEVVVTVNAGESNSSRDGMVRLDFSIKDTGIGMTRDQAEKIFSPFSQADATITRKYGGTGLGVSISKELVRMMGGTLKVISEKGIGSKFYFTFHLPGEILNPTEVATENLRDDFESNAAMDANRHRLLIAEDEPVNRKLISKIFENLKQDIVFAKDGQDCLDRLKRDIDFDAVFLDLRMPKVHGLEVAHQIRCGMCGDDVAEIPMAIMSADVLSKEEAEKVGADAFIMKPINLSEITDFLAKFAKKRSRIARPITPARIVKPSGMSEVKRIAKKEVAGDRKIKVLVAEDNEAIRNLLAKLLQKLGYSADFAEDGLLCLEKLSRTDGYDVVFSDLRMPNMDGLTLVSKIRAGHAGERNSMLPIALVTAEHISEDEYAKVDANALITKPIVLDQLKSFLETVKVSQASSVALSS